MINLHKNGRDSNPGPSNHESTVLTIILWVFQLEDVIKVELMLYKYSKKTGLNFLAKEISIVTTGIPCFDKRFHLLKKNTVSITEEIPCCSKR